jgi:hypothetical protein
MWHAFADTRGLRPPTAPSSQSHSRSLETARPVGRASAWAKVSGSQTDLLTPRHDERAEIIPFRYLPVLLGGNVTGDLPSQGEKLRVSMPTRPRFPPRRSACGDDDNVFYLFLQKQKSAQPSVPPHPLRLTRSQSRGLA